jgi:hypothetical protein
MSVAVSRELCNMFTWSVRPCLRKHRHYQMMTPLQEQHVQTFQMPHQNREFTFVCVSTLNAR